VETYQIVPDQRKKKIPGTQNTLRGNISFEIYREHFFGVVWSRGVFSTPKRFKKLYKHSFSGVNSLETVEDALMC
jgi:hypothetical protein